jgi:hypothetical protein
MDFLALPIGESLKARLNGPGKGRFVLQPLIAIALGIRDGIKDARQGKPPFIHRVLVKSERKLWVLKQGLKSIAVPFTLGIVLDMVLQWVILRTISLIEGLLVGSALVALPYAVSRALSNRIARRWVGPQG